MNIRELHAFTLLHVATRGDADAAARILSTRLGISVDASPGSVATREDGTTVLWFGPGRWLVHVPTSGFKLDHIEGCATTDLSDSRRIFSLGGDDVGDFLAASCPLDLSESVMPVGSCALTQFNRFSILLHRLAAETFHVYVERSYSLALELPGG